MIALIGFVFGQSDEKEVNACFESYKSAILEDRGEDAVNVVSSNTIDYYKKMLDISLYADSAEVAGLNVIDKMTVISVRHRVPPTEIEGMDGRSFFVYAIKNGMVGKNSVMNVEIGEIKVREGFATGQMVNNGQETPIAFSFYNEDGWKIDLSSIFPSTNAGLEQYLTELEITDTEWILQAMEMLTGTPPGDDIWQPMK